MHVKTEFLLFLNCQRASFDSLIYLYNLLKLESTIIFINHRPELSSQPHFGADGGFEPP